MTDINWGLLADFGLYDAQELDKRERIRNALAAREREQIAQAQLEREQQAQQTQQREPTRTVSAPPLPSASTYSAPVDQLAAALDAAADDAARARLLDAAPRDVRQAFRAMLAYRKMCADDPPDPYAEFSARLDAAADDDARRQVFAACDAAFLTEWRWRRTAESDDWARRFMTQANPDPMTDY